MIDFLPTPLPPRERTMLLLAAQGYSNKETARHMGIAKRTVDNRWASIRARYGARNRTEAVVRALCRGDIPPTVRRMAGVSSARTALGAA